MAFRPRRTPPPSYAGVNVSPRKSGAETTPSSSTPKKTKDGEDWISPHHTDYYGRVDKSTMDHPHLMHGDPHMPISKATRGEMPTVLDPDTGEAMGVDEGGEGTADPLANEFGPVAAEAIRAHLHMSRRGGGEDVESMMRSIDRFTAASGSTQDLALTRRAKTDSREFFELGGLEEDFESEPVDLDDVDISFGKKSSQNLDEEAWLKELDRMIEEEQYTDLELGSLESMEPDAEAEEDVEERRRKMSPRERESEEETDHIMEMIKRGDDPNQEAFGPWSETTVRVDRVQKVERGGTTVRYRALLIGGNGNGAAGFGIGKAVSPNEAIVKASKHCKRNVFYIDRCMGSGLSYDLAGKHNSCRVFMRSVRPDYGLKGHPLICEILKYAGVTDATTKSHGNRNVFNVVYATFKALMTHESLEDIALKRGKKFLNLQRARRLEI